MNTLKTFALSILSIAALGLLAACGAPPKPAVKMPQSITAVAATPAPAPKPMAAPTAPAAVQLADGVYTGNIGGKTATLTIRGGQPVAYNWGSYNGKRFALDGNVIKVDKATLTVASASNNQINGRWVLRGKGSNVALTKG